METLSESILDQAAENARIIQSEIDLLRAGHKDQHGRLIRKDFWEHVKKISDQLKNLAPLLLQDRERLWQELTEVKDEVRIAQEDRWENVRNDSFKKRSIIESESLKALSRAENTGDIGEIEQVIEVMHRILDLLRDRNANGEKITENSLFGPDIFSIRMLKPDHDSSYLAWHTAMDKIQQKKKDLHKSNFEKLKTAITQLSGSEEEKPHDTISRIKEIQACSEYKLLPFNVREELREMLNTSYLSASAKIRQINEERQQRYQEWLSHLSENLVKWNQLLEKNTGVIAVLEQKIAVLESKLNEKPDDDSYAENLKSQIQEIRAKIDDIKNTNHSVESRIKMAKEKLGQRE